MFWAEEQETEREAEPHTEQLQGHRDRRPQHKQSPRSGKTQRPLGMSPPHGFPPGPFSPATGLVCFGGVGVSSVPPCGSVGWAGGGREVTCYLCRLPWAASPGSRPGT